MSRAFVNDDHEPPRKTGCYERPPDDAAAVEAIRAEAALSGDDRLKTVAARYLRGVG